MDAAVKHLDVCIYLVINVQQKTTTNNPLIPSLILVRSAVKSYLASWCIQILYKRVLDRQTLSGDRIYINNKVRQAIPNINYMA